MALKFVGSADDLEVVIVTKLEGKELDGSEIIHATKASLRIVKLATGKTEAVLITNSKQNNTVNCQFYAAQVREARDERNDFGNISRIPCEER